MNLPSARGLRAGVPIFRYAPRPNGQQLAVLHLDTGHPPHGTRHIHDFPLVQLCSTADGHEARVIAVGAVVDPAPYGTADAATAVLFDPGILGADGAPTEWSAHPLLTVFAHRTADGVLRLPMSEERAARWRAMIAALESEAAAGTVGAEAAAAAHLMLLLVDLARLAEPHLAARGPDDPLVRAAGAVIEARYAQAISLSDVAAALAVSPGHLATAVRRGTGRTVVEWITDRRMAAARRALTETRAPIARIARDVGYPDPAYFARVFRRRHGVSARAWRVAASSP